MTGPDALEGPPAQDLTTRKWTLGSWIAGASLALIVAVLLYLCGRPLATSDLWWHLEMGEVYATTGLWPAGDPLLHTAHADAPIQHEWLFDVAVHGVDRWLGFQGLRALHVLAVAVSLWLAHSIFRRRSRTPTAAFFATALFAVLASWRFVQLRPDLLSISATLLLYRLLLEPDDPPSWRRIAAAVLLLLVWANAHSLFGVGVLLLGAGLAAALTQAILADRLAPGGATSEVEWLRVRRLAAALGLGLLATLLNPRGLAQHLTFVTSSRESAIWEIADEWLPFDLLSWREMGNSLGFSEWLLTDLTFAGFVVVAALGVVRLYRRATLEALREASPILFALSVAAIVAILVSVRFLWLTFFPLLFLLSNERRLASRAATGASGLLAIASLGLAAAHPAMTTVQTYAPEAPDSPAAYLFQPVNEFKFHADAVRFLEATGVEGNLFNTYRLGGFLAYRLAPRLRTFIDSRTEHYPVEIYREYVQVTRMEGAQPGESFRDLLDRRGVDLFVGVGIPPTKPGRRFTTAHLENAPEWLLVSRSIRHGIYLRSNERNRENLRRIAAYYEREGVPFDPLLGFDALAVLRDQPDWAEAHGMVPSGHSERLRDRLSADPRVRLQALEALGRTYVQLGAYEEQIGVDREAVLLRPRAKSPQRRLVYGLLRLGRTQEALESARALQRIDPTDRRSADFLSVAQRIAQLRADPRAAPGGSEPHAASPPPEALLNRLAP